MTNLRRGEKFLQASEPSSLQDLQWIQQATLHEIVVSETAVPGQSNKINATIERSIIIQKSSSNHF